MDLPAPLPEDDALALPIRARLFTALAGLRRPATTRELAQLVGRHPNTVRVQLQRIAAARLIECRRQQQPLGRPRHVWAIVPDALPGGQPPGAHANLSRWLARALSRGTESLDEIEAVGREIGVELAPAAPAGGAREALQDALAALGFAPRAEPRPGGIAYVLGNCPYRAAATENPAAVCTLHRGITRGLLDRLHPAAALEAFVPRDPYAAGCTIELGGG